MSESLRATNVRVRSTEAHAALRELPSVDSLLISPEMASLAGASARAELTGAIRAALEALRKELRSGRAEAPSSAEIVSRVATLLQQRSTRALRRVINATGIVLHTGLGRAPLATEAIAALTEAAAGYCNLELDLETGHRGDRHDHLRELLCELTGAEDAVVVNNNAAATYLTLHALTRDRGVIVSRGQLVEIGGSYRMPDIMAAAGCRMIEIGTTNRTHTRDYERAISADTAALLRVHTSNYRIEGFATTPTLDELAAIAHAAADRPPLLLIDDLGSGLLDDGIAAPPTSEPWDEPGVRESVRAGADVTLFSGDKLLGGPQAGIIVGRRDCIARIRSNPLMRTHRPDKLTLAALEATLRLYRDPRSLCEKLPVLRMLCADVSSIESRAMRLMAAMRQRGVTSGVSIAEDRSYAGGGALPAVDFETRAIRIDAGSFGAARLATALRAGLPPVICRIQNDAILLDCRTVFDSDVDELAEAVAAALR